MCYSAFTQSPALLYTPSQTRNEDMRSQAVRPAGVVTTVTSQRTRASAWLYNQAMLFIGRNTRST